MDWLVILERYGIPLVVAVAFWIFIQKQNKFIQDELQKELRELEQKGIENSFKTLVTIIAELSGNGLKDKFLRMQEKNENKKY